MLRSIKEIKGSHIHARDGRIGGVEALYFDDESWEVRYFVVGAGNLFAHQKVLLVPDLLREEAGADSSFVLRSSLTREQIRNAPGIETAPRCRIGERPPISRPRPTGWRAEKSRAPCGHQPTRGPSPRQTRRPPGRVIRIYGAPAR